MISVFPTSRCVLLSLIFWYLAAYKVPSFLLATRYTFPNPPAPIRLRFIRFKGQVYRSAYLKFCLAFTWPCRCGTPSRPWRRTWVESPLHPFQPFFTSFNLVKGASVFALGVSSTINFPSHSHRASVTSLPKNCDSGVSTGIESLGACSLKNSSLMWKVEIQ